MTVYDRDLLRGVKARATRCYTDGVWERGLLDDIKQVCDQLAATMPEPTFIVSYEVQAEDATWAREATPPPWTCRSVRPK